MFKYGRLKIIQQILMYPRLAVNTRGLTTILMTKTGLASRKEGLCRCWMKGHGSTGAVKDVKEIQIEKKDFRYQGIKGREISAKAEEMTVSMSSRFRIC